MSAGQGDDTSRRWATGGSGSALIQRRLERTGLRPTWERFRSRPASRLGTWGHKPERTCLRRRADPESWSRKAMVRWTPWEHERSDSAKLPKRPISATSEIESPSSQTDSAVWDSDSEVPRKAYEFGLGADSTRSKYVSLPNHLQSPFEVTCFWLK